MRLETTKIAVAAALTALLLAGATGCREKGPAEKAGEKIDEAGEKLRDALDPRGPAEKAGEKIDEALE